MGSLTVEEVAKVNERLEGEPPESIVRWALLESPMERIAVASSFQAEATAVIHMATRLRPDVPILFLDTGFHFAETLELKERLRRELGLNVVELRGDHTPASQAAAYGERLYERDPALCCELNKVVPLGRALWDYDAWISGLRRDSSPTRAGAPIVDRYLQDGRPIVKVNPVAGWSRRDVWRYLEEHDLPHHPLYELGFASIGCAPCTRIVFPGEDERAGRWASTAKLECGIHVAGTRAAAAG